MRKNLEKYRSAKKETMQIVSEAKHRAYNNLYRKLDVRDGEIDVYKLAQMKARKFRNPI